MRQLIGEERLLGRSTHCLEDLQRAEQEGCDYLGVGPINETKTKPDLNPVGINYLYEVCEATQLPWFAIGGINNSNLGLIRSAGAKRIAVLGAIMNASDPSKETINLLRALE